MPIDYSIADQIAELSFGTLNKPKANLDFAEPGTLSKHLNQLMIDAKKVKPVLSYDKWPLLASAGVEMWHRAIHSFLYSLALTESSPVWASVSGYYSSHYTMRAFAHSMGVFKLFKRQTAVQIVLKDKSWICESIGGLGEHQFYWKVVKDHPAFRKNSLFRYNHEREDKPIDESDSIHRNFSNYTDHIARYKIPTLPPIDYLADRLKKISSVTRYSDAPTPQRKKFPDLSIVQTLAFQRIVSCREFFENRFSDNRFWKAHRSPEWCRKIMEFEIAGDGVMEGINDYLKPITDLNTLS